MSVTSFEGQNLRCERGGRRVFENLSFLVNAGEVIILKGPNGSGKSSLLRMCAGLLPPAKGTMLRDTEPVAANPDGHRATLHYAGHLNALKPVFTVAENLKFWTDLYGERAGIEPALKAVALDGLADTPARYLSSGQQHRLALARLIAIPRSLWLLDEPAVGLDAAAIDNLARLIGAHQAQGGMVILSTHTGIGVEGRQLDLEKYAPVYAHDDGTFP